MPPRDTYSMTPVPLSQLLVEHVPLPVVFPIYMARSSTSMILMVIGLS